ncbi:hypothetical protein [Glutamicibacter ardleyensis]|uniref:Uncharacterized protein n=1 Tax=Glutamicibacter ardleyensis TaxID=225894 RepID=A0ABQ2DLJ9_9MICC|nr:hypothetical protein [Glutamicibacter ardleyensis]GGJ58958.1 hypothetical protein GCM10007173_17110 [Glutamicibacter ardleyensis]
MANITRTAALTVTSKLTATEMQEFLTGVPDGAEISFSHQQGDRRDLREAGRSATTIKATWTDSKS